MAYYEVHFPRGVIPREMRVQFQGGFVGMDCVVYRKNAKQSTTADGTKGATESGVEWEEFDELYVEPVDSNDVQIFPVETEDDKDLEPCTSIRIEFGRSADFYGRVVIYALEIWGVEV